MLASDYLLPVQCVLLQSSSRPIEKKTEEFVNWAD